MKISKAFYTISMVTVLGLTMVACGTESKDTKSMKDKSSSEMKDKKDMMKENEMKASMMGMFEKGMDVKASGDVEIKDNMLMLKNFTSEDGPDVHVWLTKDGNIENGYDVSKIDLKSSNQTFDISMNTVKDYNTVVIYCNDAKSVFASAPVSMMK